MAFDDDLRRALRPDDAPAGFEARVLAKVARERSDTGVPLPAGRPRRYPLVAAAIALLAAGGAWVYERQRTTEEAAERAAREARIALQIASEKLIAVQRRVNDPGSRDF